MAASRKKILVVCGGKSSEREVSLVSASAILKHLNTRTYDIQVAVIDARGRWTVPADPRRAGLAWDGAKKQAGKSVCFDPGKGFSFGIRGKSGAGGSPPDVVFPVLHGPNGEDGTVQGLLDVAGIPYVGCGVLGSALSMDKEYPKLLAPTEGIDVLPYAVLRMSASTGGPSDFKFLARKMGLPLFIKPSRQGSSIGITRVEKASGLLAAVRHARKYDDKIVVEKGIDAREIEVAVLGDGVNAQASVCGEISVARGFYDYASKYSDPDAAKLCVPAKIPASVSKKAREWAVRMFQILDGYGMARVDFLMDKKTHKLYFNEMNTIPGFTEISLYPRLWEASGLPFGRLLDELISYALKRHASRSRLKTTRS